MKTEILNAKIKSTSLGTSEGNGTLMAWLHLEGSGWGVGFGGYVLDEYVKGLDRRVDMTGIGLEFIRVILDTVGVDDWEDLPGTFIRVETEGWGGKAKGIGHITEDKWFYPEDFFKKEAKRLGK